MIKLNIRIIVLMFSLVFHCAAIYSETSSMQSVVQKDIDRINKKIDNLFIKTQCGSSAQEPMIKHILYVTYDGELEKADFEDKSFLNKIHPSFFSQGSSFMRKKYIQTEAFICNTEGELVAKSNGREIYCLGDYKDTAHSADRELNKMMSTQNYSYIFYISRTPLKTYFMVDDASEVQVLEIRGEELKSIFVR